MRRALVWVLIVLSTWQPLLAQQMLYVNPSHPSASDSTSKANNSASLPWATLGRAVWGNADRSMPSDAEAADEGDTVLVAAATYNSAVSIQDEASVLYDPVNSGSMGSPIRFVSQGIVRLNCPACESGILGAVTSDYIEWDVAAVTAGLSTYRWEIVACAETPGGGITDCPGSGVGTISPDTGPVILSGTGSSVQGAHLRTFGPTPYSGENFPGLRFQHCNGCLFANNDVSGFYHVTEGSTNNHGNGIQFYNTQNSVARNNYLHGNGTGFSFKDNVNFINSGNRFTLNLVEDTGQGGTWSHVTEAPTEEGNNYVTQNLFLNIHGFGAQVLGAGDTGHGREGFVNNTVILSATPGDGGQAGSMSGTGGSPTDFNGFDYQNNIVINGDSGMFTTNAVGTASAGVTFARNLYDAFTVRFYTSEMETNQATLANFQSAHATQQANSIDADPLFVNAAGGDYRLQGGSPALTLGRTITAVHGSSGETIPAGAYISVGQTEVIGLEVDDAEPEPGDPTYKLPIRGLRLNVGLLLTPPSPVTTGVLQ